MKRAVRFITPSPTDDERKKVYDIYMAFQNHVQPKFNPVFARYKLNNEVQGNSSVEQFATRLKVLSKDCSLEKTYINDMIRDRLVFGVRSHNICKKLLTVGADLTLTKAVQICQTYEYAQEQLKTMTSTLTTGVSMGAATAAVNYVDKGQGSSQGTKFKGAKAKGPHKGSNSNPTKGKPMKPAETDQRQCGNCGKRHAKGRWPAKSKQCFSCKKWNHFKEQCRSKNVNNVDISEDVSFDDLFIDSVESRIKNDQIFAEMEVGPSKKRLTFKVDTRSQVNILPYYAFQQLGVKTALSPSSTRLSVYNGNPLHSQGTINLTCMHAGTNHTRSVSCCRHSIDTIVWFEIMH